MLDRASSLPETTQTARGPLLPGCRHKSSSTPEGWLTRRTRAHENPSTWSSSWTSRGGPGEVAWWWSPCSGARPGAQTRPPHKRVERFSQQGWVPTMQGVENPPSATRCYELYRQCCTQETRGQPSVQKM
jgi:hypothetical protein